MLLGGETDAELAGALLGDFVKGPVGSDWPPALAHGIRLHRAIDSFTDAHPVWRTSKARFPQSQRRFASITVDVVYDHLLARAWPKYDGRPLGEFSALSYASIARFESWFPPRLQRMFPLMANEDWLAGYASLEITCKQLRRMSTRSPRLAPLAGTADTIPAIYADLENDFETFFPELQSFARAWRAKGIPTIGR